jgi:hypothetical protein
VAEIELEQALRDFDRIATRLRESKFRQLWSFEFNGKPYYLHFYRRRTGLSRFWTGESAIVQFIHLRALQGAGVSAARPVAHLSGFHIGELLGDAMIVEAIPSAIQLDRFCQDHYLRGVELTNHRKIAAQVVQIVEQIGRAKFRFSNLDLSHFLIDAGRTVYLHDVRGMRSGGWRMNDIYAFAHHAARFATRTDLLRGWNTLSPEYPFPKRNPVRQKLSTGLVRRSQQDDEDFGVLRADEWTGFFTKSSHYAQPWSVSSRLTIPQRDWESAWPILLAQLQSGQLTPIKLDTGGDVLGGEVVLAGRPVSIIVKRPRRKSFDRYLIDLFRPARAQRMWQKAWMLIALNLPCEWPMLLMQRKKMGYVTDAVVVFERVPGEQLFQADLDSIEPRQREMFFRRAGRTLRAIERNGLVHYDSKSVNWIVYQDPAHGATPVMIDVDGIRPLNFWLQGWGIQRLLRAMKLHPQYTPADSLALCQGYAPMAGGFELEDVDMKKD